MKCVNLLWLYFIFPNHSDLPAFRIFSPTDRRNLLAKALACLQVPFPLLTLTCPFNNKRLDLCTNIFWERRKIVWSTWITFRIWHRKMLAGPHAAHGIPLSTTSSNMCRYTAAAAACSSNFISQVARSLLEMNFCLVMSNIDCQCFYLALSSLRVFDITKESA